MVTRTTSLLVIAAATAAIGATGCHAASQDPAFAPLVRTKDGAGPGAAAPAHGTLYVSNRGNGTVSIYAPPYHGAPILLKTGLTSPGKLVVAPDGTLFVMDGDTYDPFLVKVFRPPYNAPPTVIGVGSELTFLDMTLDLQERLLVARSGRGRFSGMNDLAIYAPPYTASPTIVKLPDLPKALKVGDRGNLFVGSIASRGSTWNVIREYAAPYTGAPIATMALPQCFGSPVSFALDAAADLFTVLYGSTNSECPAFEYAPPYNGPPLATIGNGIEWATDVAVDRHGLLLIRSCGACYIQPTARGYVTAYEPPYTGTPRQIGGRNYTIAMALSSSGVLFLSDYHKGVSEIVGYRDPYLKKSITIVAGVDEAFSLAVLP